MAGLVPVILIGEAASFPIEMAGTRPAMTRSSGSAYGGTTERCFGVARHHLDLPTYGLAMRA
jgi:hypothetical protein